jgi:hypothetical protein
MRMLNFAYLSQTKLKQMYPQIPADFHPEKIKYGLEESLGILKIKLDSEEIVDYDSDYFKLTRIVEYLASEEEIGTVESSKPYFCGTIYANCLMLGSGCPEFRDQVQHPPPI